jgi:hypothetical protein
MHDLSLELGNEKLIALLMRLKDDGSGLSLHESVEFIDLATDERTRGQISMAQLERANLLIPRVREHLRKGAPTVG